MNIFEQFNSRLNETAGKSQKIWTDRRKVRGFPSPDRLREAALEYIAGVYASGRDHYLPRDLKDGIASILGITTEQRVQVDPDSENKLPYYNNLIDQVQQAFSQEPRIHSGPNGGKHGPKEEPYYLTEHGKSLARGKFKMPSAEIQAQPTPPASNTETSGMLWTEAPTDDPVLLESQVRTVLSRIAALPGGQLPPPPPGSEGGRTVEGTVRRFVRDADVKGWVLAQAAGVCEVCARPAPFRRSDHVPFLEVHHIRPLADGGPEKVENMIAACPNCHRELHHGTKREALRVEVIAKTVRRLVDYPAKAPGTL